MSHPRQCPFPVVFSLHSDKLQHRLAIHLHHLVVAVTLPPVVTSHGDFSCVMVIQKLMCCTKCFRSKFYINLSTYKIVLVYLSD